MASRLTTNQEIAGSTPAVVIRFYFWLYYLHQQDVNSLAVLDLDFFLIFDFICILGQ